MDALNHALMGSLVADALPFTRRLGPKAQVVAVAMGMAPDLDLLPAFIANFPPEAFSFHGLLDGAMVMRYHRTYTHSFFYTALAAVAIGLVIGRNGGGGWRRWSILVWLALLSHIVLDITNPWDVRCWLPFSARPEAWCLMPLTDPVFTGLTGAVFFVNHVLRDPFRRAGERYARRWQERTAPLAERLPGVAPLAWIVLPLLAVRVWLTAYGVFPVYMPPA